MRLWNTLHKLYRNKLAGLRSARNKGARRADRSHTRLEVEALDQRLVPSSVPNLSGLTMFFDNTTGNTLAIQSVQDQGGGKGTFTGVYKDSRDGVSTSVSGTLTFKSLSGYGYDFGMTFSGSAISNFQFNPRTGIWSEDLSRVSASGDFLTQSVSGTAGAYVGIFGIPWQYSGQEADSLSYYSSFGSYVLGSYSGTVWA
jgi:hypothetical protein